MKGFFPLKSTTFSIRESLLSSQPWKQMPGLFNLTVNILNAVIYEALKSRDITLPTKVHLSSQSYGFSSSHVGCDSWTIKKAERGRIDAFELWCWRRLLKRVPWSSRRSNQSILKETNPEYSLEGPMLKLKLQYFGHLMGRTDSLEKTLMMGKIGDRRRRGWQRMI